MSNIYYIIESFFLDVVCRVIQRDILSGENYLLLKLVNYALLNEAASLLKGRVFTISKHL